MYLEISAGDQEQHETINFILEMIKLHEITNKKPMLYFHLKLVLK